MRWFQTRTLIMLGILTVAMTVISTLLVALMPEPIAPRPRMTPPVNEAPPTPEHVVLKPHQMRDPADGPRP